MENHNNLTQTFTKQRNMLRVGGKGKWAKQMGTNKLLDSGRTSDLNTPCKVHPILLEGCEKNIFCFIHPKASRKQRTVPRS